MRTSSFYTMIIASLATMVIASPTPQGSDPHPPCPPGYACFNPAPDGGCYSCKPTGGA
ncbi:uncharacterized protein CTRU02_209758 [Colletotrichum truncatum]|uniref:Uncharacterized protein n=1 Tax=Colletotrichum truncatum TaxID=5467 RepID=A0ACC3YTH9_COLTU|nr:uncharacterized protein CTRU02_02328 [Colletotrichum truncatum]KAF6798355.1 hypothetical protein CTRU02_02328 [Colletotrichum truncatum]